MTRRTPGEDLTVSNPQDSLQPTSRPQGDTSLTLLQRLRANEPDAWRTMVRLYTQLVYQWCARSGVRGADAEDVAQDVFRKASAQLDSFRRERAGDTFRGWLRALTRTSMLQLLRREDRQPHALGGTDAQRRLQDVVDPLACLEEDSEAGEETAGLRMRALEIVRGEVEERTWDMFWLTFIEERSAVDVAQRLGVAPALVRKAKSRVLHRLKEHFAELVE
jgi:RNA polymerase sigma-70 factor (ECF subfamily)